MMCHVNEKNEQFIGHDVMKTKTSETDDGDLSTTISLSSEQSNYNVTSCTSRDITTSRNPIHQHDAAEQYNLPKRSAYL